MAATIAKIRNGVSAETKSWGRYWPKYTSSCCTPSTIERMTSPVRAWVKCAGPSAVICA